VRQASRALTAIYDAHLAPAGILSSQLPILVVVMLLAEGGEGPGVPLGAVARLLLMDRTTLTRNLAPLERAGLVRAARSASDRRSRLVTVTPAGRRALLDAFPRWQRAQEAVIERLGAAGTGELLARLSDLAKLNVAPGPG
jgi:DNA-binding MarR family transcriptional regulator